MSVMAERSGSKFLYAPFEVAHERIEANERVAQERWAALERRLANIETGLERMERRLWLAVYGVAAALLVQGMSSLLSAAP